MLMNVKLTWGSILYLQYVTNVQANWNSRWKIVNKFLAPVKPPLRMTTSRILKGMLRGTISDRDLRNYKRPKQTQTVLRSLHSCGIPNPIFTGGERASTTSRWEARRPEHENRCARRITSDLRMEQNWQPEELAMAEAHEAACSHREPKRCDSDEEDVDWVRGFGRVARGLSARQPQRGPPKPPVPSSPARSSDSEGSYVAATPPRGGVHGTLDTATSSQQNPTAVGNLRTRPSPASFHSLPTRRPLPLHGESERPSQRTARASAPAPAPRVKPVTVASKPSDKRSDGPKAATGKPRPEATAGFDADEEEALLILEAAAVAAEIELMEESDEEALLLAEAEAVAVEDPSAQPRPSVRPPVAHPTATSVPTPATRATLGGGLSLGDDDFGGAVLRFRAAAPAPRAFEAVGPNAKAASDGGARQAMRQGGLASAAGAGGFLQRKVEFERLKREEAEAEAEEAARNRIQYGASEG
eukprot:1187931-Prorocentrum_minimum.AAC.6